MLVVFVDNKNDGGASWLGLGYLISMIKSTCDYIVKYYLFDEVEKALTDAKLYQPTCVASPVLQHNYLTSMDFLGKLRNQMPRIITIIGNVLPSLYPKEIMELNPSVDYIVVGEGEYTFKNLLCNIKNNNNADFKKINGLVYRESNDEIIINQKSELISNIDNLIFPDRKHYPHMPTAFGVLSSRGCEGNCTFCAARVIHKGGVRTRSIENVLDEVEELMKEYNCAQIGFYDATFCSNKSDLIPRFTEICEGIKKRKIETNIQINLRAEQISEDIDEILQEFISVGLHQILVGFESGNEQDLKLYGKTAKKNDNVRAARYLRELGCFGYHSKLFIEYGFINFNPYSTIEKLKENSAFLRESGLPVAFKDISSNLVLYEGAPICKKIRKDGLLLDDSMPFIIDTYNFRFEDESISNLHQTILSVKTKMSDNIRKDFMMHFIVWQKLYGQNEEYENLYMQYIDYINCLTEFTLDFYDGLINRYERGKTGMSKDMMKALNDFLEITKILRKKLVSFQRRVFMDLKKKQSLIVY